MSLIDSSSIPKKGRRAQEALPDALLLIDHIYFWTSFLHVLIQCRAKITLRFRSRRRIGSRSPARSGQCQCTIRHLPSRFSRTAVPRPPLSIFLVPISAARLYLNVAHAVLPSTFTFMSENEYFVFLNSFSSGASMRIAVIGPTVIGVPALENGDIFAVRPDLIKGREIALFDRNGFTHHHVGHGLYFACLCRSTRMPENMPNTPAPSTRAPIKSLRKFIVFIDFSFFYHLKVRKRRWKCINPLSQVTAPLSESPLSYQPDLFPIRLSRTRLAHAPR